MEFSGLMGSLEEFASSLNIFVPKTPSQFFLDSDSKRMFSCWLLEPKSGNGKFVCNPRPLKMRQCVASKIDSNTKASYTSQVLFSSIQWAIFLKST